MQRRWSYTPEIMLESRASLLSRKSGSHCCLPARKKHPICSTHFDYTQSPTTHTHTHKEKKKGKQHQITRPIEIFQPYEPQKIKKKPGFLIFEKNSDFIRRRGARFLERDTGDGVSICRRNFTREKRANS